MTNSAEHKGAAKRSTTEPPPRKPAARKTLLLVDDDVQFAKMLRVLLEGQRFEVVEASNGAAALREVMARDFDVILCDMVMPEFPGDMFYRAVERVKPAQCRRFIFMTGYRGDQKVVEFIGKVGGFVVWKPFEFKALQNAIDTLQGRVRASPA